MLHSRDHKNKNLVLEAMFNGYLILTQMDDLITNLFISINIQTQIYTIMVSSIDTTF